jgi:hypothetical protein
MARHCCTILVFLMATLATSTWASVTVNSPWNNSAVGTTVNYSATGTAPNCKEGVASMGIYVDDVLKYTENGDSLNHGMSFEPGSYNTVVEEWDYCGGATYTAVPITVTNKTGVWVMAPANNANATSPVTYQATATTYACSKGVASMGVYINNVLTYTTQGAMLKTNLNFNAGSYNTVVEEWDYCGGASYTPVKITVTGHGDPTLSNLQASGRWNSWGELAPEYNICDSCGSKVTWSMEQHIKSPSLSGNASQFNIGGTTPYSDVLFSNPLIGQNSSQGLPDTKHTLLPTLYNFTYDSYFYTTELSSAQALEFDISMYFNGLSLIFGQQCNLGGGNFWEVWNNVHAEWVSTGIPCHPINGGWNHVTLQVQRQRDNSLLYQSITLNGVTKTLNWSYPPGSCPPSWWGITVNYQMDGDYKQAAYTTYVDNFSLTYGP